ncbi:MAG: methyltransferase [Chloroflexi bacterium]|nr:methyltransferase [Chloroflexota bacterium]
MTSRERIEMTLCHREPDRIPLDLGGCGQTGMHVSSVYLLRQALNLDPPGTPVKVIEPYQMLGEIGLDLMDVLGVDVISLGGKTTLFGYPNEGWKLWTTFDRTPVLVPEGFNTQPEPNGDILMYPQGDRSARPSGRMPAGGWYFDSLVRQPPIDEAALDVQDNLEEFGPIAEEELASLSQESHRLYSDTDRAIMLVLSGMGFGDIALVPGPMLRDPRGIRDIEEWYVSTITRREYVQGVFERQCQIAMDNLARIHQAVGDRPTVAWISGTDFGTQNGPFLAPRTFRELYLPYYRYINDWIHTHTTWRTFIHTCGAIVPLIPLIIEAGFDILNPVQISAAGMDPATLKQQHGRDITFWGGGIDTQRTLPFGTPAEVRKEVAERIQVLAPGGGFVFSPIHNVQAGVPVENLIAMYQAASDFGSHYPPGSRGTCL